MEGHKYSTLISRKILIVEPSGITNLDVMMLIVGGHVYSSLISRMYLNLDDMLCRRGLRPTLKQDGFGEDGDFLDCRHHHDDGY
jgi:hypothetical protein